MIPEATRIVGDVLKRKGSLKNLVFSSKFKNTKALYALTCETLRYRKPLLDIAADCGVLKDKRLKNDDNLVAVLMYEHLLGKGALGRFKVILHKYKNSIHSKCERIKIDCGMTDLRQALQKLLPFNASDRQLPKYVRINTILDKKEHVITQLRKQFQLRENSRTDDILLDDTGNWFIEDVHVPNLLRFPTSVQLHNHPLYLSGKIIIQDKASCFPAFILNPPSGSTVIDCCAAPGNKTSHLAAIMGNQGKVLAFDKDAKRLSTLKKLVSKAGATCVHAECKDFLSVKPHDDMYRNVEYILVDPSCSGSGMVNRQQQFTDEEDSGTTERLQQLSKFQISILKHALSFPHVKKVVYSTCSVHDEENEQVVEEVYSQCSDRFNIENIMPEWRYRGKEIYEHGACCLRMSYEDCQTNGFFVGSFISKNTEPSDIEQLDKVKSETSDELKRLDNSEDHLCVRTKDFGSRKKKMKKNNKKVYGVCKSNGEKKLSVAKKNKMLLKATSTWTVIKQGV
ncbi:28S rRNA (cytosine-C(5))-methyltransferase-like [Ruditapes philippinarum]|uniref:28S rRNA (cytosine-C(5))-methyltransferase-like n=1 Tax=Ruditapes philippinarum TaxID=129788 RepID=UPI00295ADBFD|nr:28S rRNA (cytosine-C(5))-methyltransferase-like [Ruditapes philippinarum]